MSIKVKPSQLKSKWIQQILDNSEFEGLHDLVRASTEHIIQSALEGEVSDFLGREWYERDEETKRRQGYRNGYYPRQAKTKEGKLDLQVPRVRNADEPFESQLLKRLCDLEDRLNQMAVEMYVRGLSMRDIESVLADEKGKPILSRNRVSELSESLYAEYEAFTQRNLSEYDVVYLFVDGVYESIRRYTRNQTILACWGVCSNGHKVLLHLGAAGEESEDSWSAFFEEMKSRGLRQPLLVTSDGHKGLIKAIVRSFPKAKRQRCLAHKMRNLINKIPSDIQKEVKAYVHDIYYAADYNTAEALSVKFIERYADIYPEMIRSFQQDIDACLIQLEFPTGHRRLIRTTNLIERSFVEEKRRTKIIPQHQNEKGAIKLVFAVLIRASYNWQKINMNELDLVILKKIRKTIVPDLDLNEKISYEWAA